jgi:nucleoside-triphosphatase THEP1
MPDKPIIILSGVSGSGKTTLCNHIYKQLMSMEIDVAGVLSLPYFDNGRKTKILVKNLKSGEQEILAGLDDVFDGPKIGQWNFSCKGLETGLNAMRESSPCDVLIIDEIGPMEILNSKGWHFALELLNSLNYKKAIIPMRPWLLDQFMELTPPSTIVGITTDPLSRKIAMKDVLRLLFCSGIKIQNHMPKQQLILN